VTKKNQEVGADSMREGTSLITKGQNLAVDLNDESTGLAGTHVDGETEISLAAALLPHGKKSLESKLGPTHCTKK
jgi:hypothetical protein